jgi:hypothetical protein
LFLRALLLLAAAAAAGRRRRSVLLFAAVVAWLLLLLLLRRHARERYKARERDTKRSRARLIAHTAPKTNTKHKTKNIRNQAAADDAVASRLTAGAGVVQLYRYPGLSETKAATLLHKAQKKVSDGIASVDGELCYNVELAAPLTPQEAETLSWCAFCVGSGLCVCVCVCVCVG